MNNIKLLREKKNISIRELSKLTGLTFSYLSELENGIKNNPTKAAMDKISNALSHTVDTVFYKNIDQKEKGV